MTPNKTRTAPPIFGEPKPFDRYQVYFWSEWNKQFFAVEQEFDASAFKVLKKAAFPGGTIDVLTFAYKDQDYPSSNHPQPLPFDPKHPTIGFSGSIRMTRVLLDSLQDSIALRKAYELCEVDSTAGPLKTAVGYLKKASSTEKARAVEEVQSYVKSASGTKRDTLRQSCPTEIFAIPLASGTADAKWEIYKGTSLSLEEAWMTKIVFGMLLALLS